MYTVYQHKNKLNGKMYFGITGRKPEERWGKNGRNYKSTPHFFSAINKYGWDNFEHHILYENLTKEEALSKEKELIKKYNTQDKNLGYNILDGGQLTELPLEARIKIFKSMIGNKNSLGCPCSEEKKKKISKAQKGKKLTKEHRDKLSEAAKKRHVPCSEDKRLKLSQSHPYKKKVLCLETNCIYFSVQECARQLGLHATNVTKVCSGTLKTTGGYHLKYYNDTINA